MTHVDTPQTRCMAGVARCDITPPIGIYHRMWGAATHDRATGVHRPLTATALWLQPSHPWAQWPNLEGDARAQILVALDHCVVDGAELTRMREAIAVAVGITPAQVHITLSHTHGSGWMSRSRAHLPGGELIGPYLDEVTSKLTTLAIRAKGAQGSSLIVYGKGKCALAAQRDYHDEKNNQYVCGFNPLGTADDTVLVATIHSFDAGCVILGWDIQASIVNYACHPTTLAWDNTLISPDFVGATREVIEKVTVAHCLFLQGASGDLGPREGFVGETRVADRNGRQLAYAALAALESVPINGWRYVYAGPVVSGATIGTWKYEPIDQETRDRRARWDIRQFVVDLPYRHDLPTLDETQAALHHWSAEEEHARAGGNAAKIRDCRAMVEQLTRRLHRLQSIPPGKVFPYRVNLWALGDAFWVLVPGELYQAFQIALRQQYPDHPIVVITLTDDWQPGYVPAASAYGHGIYQETIACVAPGSLEMLIDAVSREMKQMMN
jgi:hypothetical protein